MTKSTGWNNASELDGCAWVCGYCGCRVGNDLGYSKHYPEKDVIYVCPNCDCPTVFVSTGSGSLKQIPGSVRGGKVDGLPEMVDAMFSEVRSCFQHGLYTASVLCARKLLMHVAVDKGADEDLQFCDYVGYLSDNHYVPPDSQLWVDEIRKRSNEANHEIVMMGEQDAAQLLDFCEMLLRFGYEFASKLRRK